jgi:signal transduction histidine kinase
LSDAYAGAVSGGTSVDSSRLVRARPLVVDAALMVVAGAGILLSVVHAGHHLPGLEQPASNVFAVAAYVAVLGRRRWPWASSIAALAACTGYLTVGGHYWWILPAPLVVLFHLAASGRARVRLPVVATVCGVLLVGVPALSSPGHWWSGGGHEASVAVFAGCCIALATGDAVRSRHAYLAEVEERARQAEWERARHAREQVMRERIRIARDLHDSVGHHIALINAQAAMAARVFDTEPDATRVALAHITAESRAALEDMRGTVGLLRQSDDPAPPTGPPPGLNAVGELVDQFKRSGMPVDLTVHGVPRPVPTGVDLAAYHIVRESLTNASKHAASAATRVRIDYAPEAVTVRVDNDHCDDASPAARGDGHGLIGMRERAAAAGGQLRVGPRPDGGYQVHAVLPLTRAANP